MQRLGKWLEQIGRNPRLNGLAVLGGVLGLVLIVVAVATVVAGWASGWPFWAVLVVGIPTLASVVCVFLLAAILASTRRPYRRALRLMVWRYIVDLDDERHRLAPDQYPTAQSEGVRTREESADPTRGDRLYRDFLHLPPEGDYR